MGGREGEQLVPSLLPAALPALPLGILGTVLGMVVNFTPDLRVEGYYSARRSGVKFTTPAPYPGSPAVTLPAEVKELIAPAPATNTTNPIPIVSSPGGGRV